MFAAGSALVAAAAVYYAVSAHLRLRGMVVPVYKMRVCAACGLPRDLAAYPTTASRRCVACVQLSGSAPKPKTGRQRLWQAQVRRIQCEVRKANPGMPTLGAAECRKLLGAGNCNELWDILAARLEPGMAEDNYGQWHVDHASPVAAFDLAQPDHRVRAFHHANLQPLWAHANLNKGCALPAPATPRESADTPDTPAPPAPPLQGPAPSAVLPP